jgi:hypothetical protein
MKKRMTERAGFVTFDFCDRPDALGLNLCVVDDDWRFAVRFVQEVDDFKSEAKQNEWADGKSWGRDVLTNLAASVLPIYAEQLPGLSQLIITGFPEHSTSDCFLADFLKEPSHRWRTTFLIDIHDSDSDRSLGDLVVLPMLKAARYNRELCTA